MQPYFTIVIPYTSSKYRTEWHPTTPVGPFATLTRGAFTTPEQAIEWARAKLNGLPYSIEEVK